MIDTANKFLVNANASAIGKVSIGRLLATHGMMPDDALNLAAYLVLLAEPSASHKFSEVLEAVKKA